MNNLQRHERSDAIKWFVVGLAIVLIIAAIVLGVFSNWYTNWDVSTWFGQGQQEETEEDNADSDAGAVITEGESNGLALMSARIAAEDYAEYGVSPLADTAYTITATVSPATADNKTVDWSVAWANASSSWANGKTVTGYVTVSPSGDGSTTATVSCLQAFGEQVIVTCTSRDNSEIKATCTVDYKQRFNVSGATLNVGGSTYNLSSGQAVPLASSATLSVDTSSDAYTVADDVTVSTAVYFSQAFEDALYDYFTDSYFGYDISNTAIKTLDENAFSVADMFYGIIDYVADDIRVSLGDDWALADIMDYVKSSYSGNVFDFKISVSSSTGNTTVTYSVPVERSSMIVSVGNISLSEEGIVF